jgi:hypothetical protein
MPAGDISLGVARRGVPLLARLVMNLLHQANLAQVAVVVRHELLAVADAVDADAYPTKIVVGFTQAAIADESRFRSHDRIRAVIGPAG